MKSRLQRRDFLRAAGAAAAVGVICQSGGKLPGEDDSSTKPKGCVVGQPQGAQVGADVLAAGGNAVDAAVAAALTAGVVAVNACGIGGYGGHMVIALSDRKKVTAIDFNSTAPAAARPDMFPLDEKGEVKGRLNTTGWLAAGVPATLAGLQFALDRYGTMPFSKLVKPAIRLARDGFEISTGLANAARILRAQLQADATTAKFLLPKGEPIQAGDTFRNPEVADLLQALAERNSVDPFYHGDIARRIAAAFKMHGGLVTEDDLAAYQAREVEPHKFSWRGFSLLTAPLTAGGLTVLQTLGALKGMAWERLPPEDPRAAHARLEAQRLAWHDRLTLLGDPQKAEVPVRRLLSEEYAKQQAARVEEAVKAKRPVAAGTDGRGAGGTIHISAIDGQGNMVALSLTHGEAFGARVTVDGLGLLLGHGMSRFDPRPGRPNSVGPGKRPLHNMCPTIVLRDDRPVLAIGGTGGRRIPNALVDVLLQFVGRDRTLAEAVAAPRLHTEGGLAVTVEPKWPEGDVEYLRGVGYSVTRGPSAIIQAAERGTRSAECRTVSR